jgi:hypothetical protein
VFVGSGCAALARILGEPERPSSRDKAAPDANPPRSAMPNNINPDLPGDHLAHPHRGVTGSSGIRRSRLKQVAIELSRSKRRQARGMSDGVLFETFEYPDSTGLHPAVLDDRGLDAALSGIAARAPLPVRLLVTVADRTPLAVEAVAYFVV